MPALAARIVRSGVTAFPVVGLAGTGTAAADGGHGHHRHRGRGHHPVVTDAQRQCMADLGFGFGPGVPRLDFNDPAVAKRINPCEFSIWLRALSRFT